MKNKVHKSFSVLTSATLAASLLLSSGVAAVSAEEASSSDAPAVKVAFPDVLQTHWARSHVAKLAAAGVVRGYTDGNFQPTRNVTQQEAIVMVIRMVGLEDEALARSGDVVTGLGENSFFTKYVVKALEERILNLGEETMAAQADDTPWGTRPATREWIAKLIVRAIGETPDESASLAFLDAAQVSSDAAGYVAKSQELELVSGFSDNTFKPKDAVTRAQIVTILSRADRFIPDDPQKFVSGFVVNRTSSSLQLRTAAGGVETLSLDGETLAFDEDGAEIGIDELANMNAVRIVYQGNVAYYIEKTGEDAMLETIDGEIGAVDVGGMTLTLNFSDGTEQSYLLASNVSVADADGNGLSLSELTEGSDVRLQRLQGTTDVTSIVVLEEAFNATGTGVVVDVDEGDNEITFNDSQGRAVTYPIAADAALSVKNSPIDDIGELEDGDTFQYEIRDGVIVSLNVTVQRYMTVEGEFQVVAEGTTAGDTITILQNGTTPLAKLLDDDVEVSIEGMDDADLNDLQTGDRVELRISGANDRVDRIAVKNRNIEQLRSVTIDRVDEDYLIVRDADDEARFFKITDRTVFTYDGEEQSLDDMLDELDPGRKVTINVSSDQLVGLEIVTKVSGIVTKVNTSDRTITVKTEDNETVTVPYSSNANVVVPLQTSANVSDIAIGTKAYVSMSSRSDTANTIELEKSFVYTLQSVTTSNRRIVATDTKGASVTLQLDASTAIRNEDNDSVTLASLTSGRPIVVNYIGRKIVSVKEAELIRGVVTTLDVTGGRLIVTGFDNDANSFDLKKGITVVNGTSVTSNASSLKLNDRVQVVVDAQGKPHVQLAQVEVKRFNSYSSSNDEITVKISKIGDPNKFKLDSDVHVHTSEGASLSLLSLKENDQITMYLLNGLVIELVR